MRRDTTPLRFLTILIGYQSVQLWLTNGKCPKESTTDRARSKLLFTRQILPNTVNVWKHRGSRGCWFLFPPCFHEAAPLFPRTTTGGVHGRRFGSQNRQRIDVAGRQN